MSDDMLDVYLYHTNPEQLDNYDKQTVFANACNRVREWLKEEVPKRLRIEEILINRKATGLTYMSFFVTDKRAHELDTMALSLRVLESGHIELEDEDDKVVYTTKSIAQDDIILAKLQDVIDHYDDDYGKNFRDDYY
jgi:hypothetical protein